MEPENPERHPFSADRAIEEVAHDRLGRSFFAGKLAEVVCGWNENDSLVMALYGKWGVGKTSVKNLFKCHCKQKGDPWIVEFNPWQWSAQDKIFETFFRLVGERLGKQDASKQNKQLARKWKYYAASWGIGSELAKNIHNVLSQLMLVSVASAWLTTTTTSPLVRSVSQFVSVTTILLSAIAIILPGVFERVVAFFDAKGAYHEQDTEERRQELVAELKKLKKPVVVIIDDIDRLNRDEIKIVIQLVKANSDLPKIVFLLLFEEEKVARALDDLSFQNGREYLEKIVQAAFDVPKVPEGKLHKILFDGIEEIFVGIDISRTWDKRRWDHIFNEYLKNYFQTLRDVYRFLSMLRFEAGIHRNADVLEVNPIDLIVLQLLRVFEHPVYDKVKESFSNQNANFILKTLYFLEKKEAQVNVVLEDILKEVSPDKRVTLKGILVALFPQVSENFSGSDDNWERDLRICHSTHFATYFELALSEQTFSALEIAAFLRWSTDPAAVVGALKEYNKQGRLTEFLERIGSYAESFPSAAIPTFLQGVLDVSEEFPPTDPDLFSGSAVVQTSRLLRALLLRLPEGSRAPLLLTLFSASSAFTLPAYLVSWDERGQPNGGDRVLIFSEDALPKLQMLCAQKIKAAALDGRLKDSEHMLWLLHCWRIWGNNGEAEEWVRKFVEDPASALQLTMAAVSVGTVRGHRGSRRYDALLLKSLEQFVNVEDLWRLLIQIHKDLLGNREQHILALFQRGLENKREGRPYDRLQDDPFMAPE